MAELCCWDEAPESNDDVKVCLTVGDVIFEARHENGYFRALCKIREQLEREGMLLICYGASENVYPSPMIEAMGSGEKAYKLTLGRPALSADLVCIFDTGPEMRPSTVKVQREFYQKWLKSLS